MTRRRKQHNFMPARLTPFFLLLLLVAGCATMSSRGRARPIPVSSDPAGAIVQIVCDGSGMLELKTPTRVELHPGAKQCIFTFAKEGYATKSVALGRTTSPDTYRNLGPYDEKSRWSWHFVPAGVAGAIVDTISGAAYDFDRNELHVRLEKL
ncbi:MAG TPA: hypothetical protein VEZ11_10555 [Thermoanaerobaculia bacterium]|nr:hypothetical protein [Thermoanaerobaculia bacterium]